jgi:membrane fusion protein, multidrug efflux system
MSSFEAKPGSVGSIADAEPRRRAARRPYVILAVAILVLLGGIGTYLALTAGEEHTDDAQVTADLIPIAARVAGQVTRVFIRENQLVKAGDPIAQLDDADYVAKERQAEAELAIAKAQADAADAQVTVAKAALSRAETDTRRSENDLRRARELRQANAAPQERLDNAEVASDAARASVTQGQAQLASTRANADLAHARMDSAAAALELARLQRSYTHITAPADGMASKLSVHEGQLCSVGQPIVELVPTLTYVVANFKETQIGKMHPGQKADIEIDAFPHRTFEGTVESLAGGTGASFSLLPPDNASGNFVKVVQRVPVRIAWVKPPADIVLRAGLSADVTVEVTQ